MFRTQNQSFHSVAKQANLFCICQRFAKRGIPRRPRRKLRHFKPPRPRDPDSPPVDTSKTRTLSATPWGLPRYPVPRVQETSVEFHQNLNSLCRIVKAKMGCYGITVSHYTHSSKV